MSAWKSCQNISRMTEQDMHNLVTFSKALSNFYFNCPSVHLPCIIHDSVKPMCDGKNSTVRKFFTNCLLNKFISF